MSDDSASRLREIRQRADAGEYHCREHFGQFDADADVSWLLDHLDALTRERDEANQDRDAMRWQVLGSIQTARSERDDALERAETAEAQAEASRATLEEERRMALDDPAEQRAERYALEAGDLTRRLMASEATLARVEQERDAYWADLCEVKAGSGVVPQALYDEAMARAKRAEATLARVQGLIEQWRGQGGHEALVAIQCADQLEQALSSPLPAEETP